MKTNRLRKGRPALGGRLAALLLLLPPAALVSWQVIKAAVVNSYAARAPAAASFIAPNDPQVRIGSAMLEFRLRNGNVSPASQMAALAALRGEPIAEEPFLLAAIAALARGEDARGEQLLIEARRRNPRSRITRLLLIDRHMRHQRPKEAAQEMAALAKLVTRTAEVLVPELARMAADPRNRQTLKTVLDADPPLRNAVLTRLAATGAPTETILSLAGPTPSPKSGAGAEWQRTLLTGMVARGDSRGAYALWQTFNGKPASAPWQGVYDGSFRGLPGLPPFNWQLSSGSDGAAEPTPGSGLQVSYYGRNSTELANQLLLLTPGRYRLQYAAQGDASGEGSRLAWRVTCRPGNQMLVEVPVQKVNSTARTFGGDFDVPSGPCAAQSLTLVGAAGEFPTEQSATFRDLKIGRVGS